MRFKYQGARITLRGVRDKITSCTGITGKNLQGLLNTGAVEQVIQLNHIVETPANTQLIPPAVQDILDQHQ